MTKARNIADLLDANGDVKSASLDNVPASNDASALTTGTLPNARLPNNISDGGTTGTKVASGTTAERGSTAGQWRYNSSTGFFEGRNGTEFSSLEPLPTVTSVDDTEIDSAGGGNQTIVVTGTNFTSGGTISFVGNAGANFNASTTTLNSSTQVTAVAPKSSFLNAQEPYSVKFTASSGSSGTSANGLISVDNTPTWSTSAGTIYTGNDLQNVSVTVSATDVDGDTISYSETTSVLSGAGLSLNSSTGVISGTPTGVSSNTTYTFTLRATSGGKTSDRQFSIVITNAVVQAFNYTGSDQTFTIPSGVTSATIQAWGAGGGSDSLNSGKYGAGGGYATGVLAVSAGDVMKIVIGQGGRLGSHGGSGGSGGGYSGIFLTSVSHANARLIAGAGGGAGDENNGGEGGGTTGTNGRDNASTFNSGKGGTQSAGGLAGNATYTSQSGILPTAGSALQGGDGGGDAGGGHGYTPASYGGGGRGGHEPGGSQGGGGGGGGYYGGGGGDGNAYGNNGGGGGAGGGGGSSYIGHSSVSNGSTISATQTTSGGASASNYSSGIGGAGTNATGGNGKLVITY